MGFSMFMWLKAMMTFEAKHIEEASKALDDSLETISSFRLSLRMYSEIWSL